MQDRLGLLQQLGALPELEPVNWAGGRPASRWRIGTFLNARGEALEQPQLPTVWVTVPRTAWWSPSWVSPPDALEVAVGGGTAFRPLRHKAR